MFGLQKSNSAPNILTAFIATLITFVCFAFLPKIQKYKAEILSSEILPSEIHVFDDLDGDTISEKIRFIPDFKGTSAIILEKNAKMLYQHNFSGQFSNPNFQFIHDYNNDKLKEIYVFTLRNNSLLLHIIEGVTRKIIAEDVFISTFLFHATNPDIGVSDCEFHDFDDDGVLDLFINISCSFTYKNRKNAIYNIAKQELKTNRSTGVPLSGDVQLFDINNDGDFEIFGNYLALGNSPSNYFLSDTFMWLLTPNIKSEMLYPPQIIGHYPGKVITRPLVQNNGNKIALFSCYSGGNDDSTYIAIVSQNGKQLQKLNIDYNISVRGAFFTTTPENKPSKIVLFSSDGKLQQFDSRLNKISEEILFDFYSYILEFDIDNDSYKEQIFLDLNHNLILARNNFQHPIFLSIKATSWRAISVEYTKQGKQLLNIQTADTLYKIDYHKNPIYFLRYFIYFLIWGVSFLLFHFIGRVYNRMATRRYESEKKMATLQITAVENQLNPHFNLNILNSIGALYETHEIDKAQYYMGKYSKLLRNSLMQAGKISVTIEEELEFTRNYLELEKLRMNHSFDYSISCEEDVINVEIPKMLIHTFCENSVKHGLRHLTEKGRLNIHFLREKKLIKIFISDNGIGRAKAKQYSLMSTGKGLEIVKQTLKLYFQLKQKQINYNISDIYDEQQNIAGTKVEITIPV